MELIKVSKDVLVNPGKISCVVQRKVKGTAIYSVMVEGTSYEIDDIEAFLSEINRFSNKPNQQYFSG